MPLAWLFSDRARLVPLYLTVVLCLIFALSYFVGASRDGLIHAVFSEQQILGTVLMFCLVPGYLLWSMRKLHSKTLTHLDNLAALAPLTPLSVAQVRCQHIRRALLPLLIVGMGYGAYQNIGLVQSLWQGRGTVGFDLAFLVGNILVWGVVTLVLLWRLPVTAALYRVGSSVEVDIYNIDAVKPMTRIVIWDLLIVAGAMAFMPLQSLDADFRLVNYQSGTTVGIVSALSLFFVPLYGVHRRIRHAKHARVDKLQQALRDIDRADVVQLEAAAAHLARVRSIHTWPLDLNLIARVFAYGVIPPIAWVAAAFVERLVDGVA